MASGPGDGNPIKTSPCSVYSEATMTETGYAFTSINCGSESTTNERQIILGKGH